METIIQFVVLFCHGPFRCNLIVFVRCLTGGGNESRDERHLPRFSLAVLIHVSKFLLKLLQFCQMNIWRLKINPVISKTMKNFLIVMQIKVCICSFTFLFLFFTLKCEYKFGKCLKYNLLVRKSSLKLNSLKFAKCKRWR